MADFFTLTLQQIQSHLKAGEFEAALPLGKKLVEQAPNQAASWFALGQVQLMRVELPMAESCFEQAVRLDPKNAVHWTNLALAVLGRGRAKDAEAHARRAIALDPTTDAVWINLGSSLYHQNRWAESAAAYREAIARAPQNAAAWSNLGSAEIRQENLEAAQAALERSLTLGPNPETAVMYGTLLMRRNQLSLAAHILQQVIAQAPDLHLAWLAWGDVQGMLGFPAVAEKAFRRVLQADPRNYQAQLNLALSLLTQFHIAEAEKVARELVAAHPKDAEAWAMLAGIQQASANTIESLQAYQRAVELAPDHSRHSRLLAAMQYAIDAYPEGLLAAHRVWDATYGRGPRFPPVPAGVSSQSNRPLRIGFLSANFNRHPIAFLALPLLENMDRSRATTLLYSDRFEEDQFTSRFKAAADVWHSVGVTIDDELAALMRHDEVDVLIDLMGHTGRRLPLLARKPVPLQVTWLGYAGTTGVAAIDYLIADRFHVRPGEESWYQEAVLRLPHSYAIYGPPPYLPAVNALPAKAGGQFTFGCLNNPAKFTPKLLNAWAEILKRAENSRLFLQFAGLGEKDIQAPIRQRMIDQGIPPDRLRFSGTATHPEFLAAYNEIDLALDTQPYSGGVTTCEAPWMGVPVVTCPGNTFAGRHSTSYLTSAGLGEFVAADLTGYIDLAVSWANRVDELGELRATLRERAAASPIADAKQFAQDFVSMISQACVARKA